MDNSMKLHLESQASEWQFKDEGNANLLLSYCSPGSSPFRGCLLRMAKIEANAGAGTAPKPPSYDARDIMEYRTKVITPLLGDLVAPPVLIEVGFDFLQAIAHSPAIQIARKPQRRAKNVDTSQRWALLEVDHTLPFGIPPVQPATAHGSVSAPTGVHVVTFEIKPKWGFKRAIGSEAAKYISKAHIGAKVATCRYCMHRVLKDSAQPHRASPDISGSVEVNGGSDQLFCPLDLYSSNANRVRRAFKYLLKDPRNNFGLLINGERVDALDLSSTAEPPWFPGLLDFLGVEVTPSGNLGTAKANCAQALSDFLEAMLRVGGHPLQFLRTHQEQLDQFDIEGVFPMFSVLLALPESKRTDLKHPDWSDVVQKYHDRLVPHTSQSQRLDKASPEFLRQSVLEFLISATLKDCTLLLTVVRDNENPSCHHAATYSSLVGETHSMDTWRPLNFRCSGEGQSNLTYLFKVTFVDMDPKPSNRIPHYFDLDKTIVDNFLQSGFIRQCVNSDETVNYIL